MNTAGCAHMRQPKVLVVLFDNRYTYLLLLLLHCSFTACDITAMYDDKI